MRSKARLYEDFRFGSETAGRAQLRWIQSCDKELDRRARSLPTVRVFSTAPPAAGWFSNSLRSKGILQITPRIRSEASNLYAGRRTTASKPAHIAEGALPAEELKQEFPPIALPIRPPFPPMEAKAGG